MTHIALGLLSAVLIWWLGTATVLFLDTLPRRTHAITIVGATLLALVAVTCVIATRDHTTAGAAHLAFASVIVIWGWLELSYYLGFVTGVHARPCPPHCPAARRFALAIGASLFHELAVVCVSMLVIVMTWNAPNPVAGWCILALWLMRWSTKLNLFLGMPHFQVSWLPEHLRFLGSYVRQRACNPLLPFSVLVPAAIAVSLLVHASGPELAPFERSGRALVGALLLLGVLEHGFLAFSGAERALWGWVARGDRST
ncbi:MAG: DUF3623 domain-containing protein [Gammaproteobacteria bacterium]|nr:DUF3623 domain-containing protein [Gammaproteobacteria bacterium]